MKEMNSTEKCAKFKNSIELFFNTANKSKQMLDSAI